PSSFQMVVMATAMRAQLGSWSQRTGERPMDRSRLLSTPVVGWNSQAQMTEAMAVDTAIVQIKIVRYTVMPRTPIVPSSATGTASASPTGTVYSVNSTVTRRLLTKRVDESSSL